MATSMGGASQRMVWARKQRGMIQARNGCRKVTRRTLRMRSRDSGANQASRWGGREYSMAMGGVGLWVSPLKFARDTETTVVCFCPTRGVKCRERGASELWWRKQAGRETRRLRLAQLFIAASRWYGRGRRSRPDPSIENEWERSRKLDDHRPACVIREAEVEKKIRRRTSSEANQAEQL